ncbi:hypothetical protein PVAND_008061 [Polypedilum vanderplanki]|uniref:Uncharacterized protein n=1 Tax=Polypedilum vanderplanki TaxID=319348 RepID=A0A9J6C8Y1_POLVA|nr:hypothetical protein PVAND_008061 [Polypedilum vanderplanki]
MDTSDDEKWEDFFGSSTDLTPSVIGYYDRLSGSFQADKIIGLPTNATDNVNEQSPPKPKLIVSKIPTKPINKSTLKFSPSPVVVAAKTLQIISPNVHRMISSHQTTTETITSNPYKTSSGSSNLLVSNKRLGDKSTVNLPTRRNFLKSNKPTGIAIPLTKNLSKISQSNGLVDSIEPIVHTITDNHCHDNEEITYKSKEIIADSEKTPTNCDHNFNYDDEDEDDNIQNVLNKTSELINNLLLSSGSNDSNLKSLDIHENSECIKESINNNELENKDIKEMKNSRNNNKKYQPLHSDTDDDDVGKRICDKTNLKFSKSLENVKNEIDAKQIQTTPTASPKLTYSRAKLQPTQKSTDCTTASTSSDGKLNASPSTKHRPLSAASISSSSSSTSSASSSNSFGNDHLPSGGKFVVNSTYLASIESLADHSENEGNPSLTMCERAALEIVDSEKSYVEDLGQIIKGYLQDWKERACLKTDELDILFSNIQEIYEFNSSLLEKLIESQNDPQLISKCFIQEHERFDVYTTYCTKYPEAISLLTTLLQASHTNALLTSTQKMLKHTLPLGSYLLKPVQMILKYHLLLDNLKKHCDLPEVKEAHEMMKDVARNIDQVKKKLEQKNRVKELSGVLDGWLGPDLTVLGELRQEGLLMEHNKPRIVFLFETMLIICKPKEDKRLQFKTYIPCKTLMLVEHLPGDPTSFHVLPFSDPRSQIKLTAKNRDQKRLWAQQIKQAMLEHFDIPSRAKELVFKLGDEEDRPCDKQIWKWSHSSSSSTPEYLERRHQYRRSEVRYRSKKAKKNAKTASLERGRIKERRESFISYSREDLLNNDKDHLKKCEHQENCNCDVIKKELSSTLKQKRSKSETRNPEEDENKCKDEPPVPLSPLEIKMYNSKTLPKRIEKIKKNRERRETAKFYMPLDDENQNQSTSTEQQQQQETVLKIVETSDNKDLKSSEKINEANTQKVQKKKKDAEIIKSILVQSELANRRIQNKSMSRRTSLEKIEQSSPLSSRKLAEALAAIKIENVPPRKSIDNSDCKRSAIEEPLYEELLRNVHVPYKFAPSMLKRSQSVSSASSVKDKIEASTTTINDDDGSDCDYVTLTYSNDKLETIDGVFVNQESSGKNSSGGSSDDVKMDKSLTQSENNLDRRDSMPAIPKQKSFLHKFMNSKSIDEDATSQKSMSISSRKSFEGGLNLSWKNMIYKTSTTDISTTTNVASPPIYRQGSEDLGSRIANVDYADPRTLFASSSNILINKSSLNQSQRDSVVSSSTDSIIDQQKNLIHQHYDTFSDSYYEDTAESVLENDFRDSAIYSDDSNEKKSDSTLSPNDDNHIYATVNKSPQNKPLIPPRIPKKPNLLLKSSFANRSAPSFTTFSISPVSPTTSSLHPPVPQKPSNLKTPEIRNAIFNIRKVNQFTETSSMNNVKQKFSVYY